MIKLIAICAFIVALLYSCNMEFEEELKEEADYCRDVANGVYPDYHGNYDKVCNLSSVPTKGQ